MCYVVLKKMKESGVMKMTISDLSTTGRRGQPIYGTAAILRRMFSTEELAQHEADLREYKRLVRELGYDRSSDD